MTDTVHTEATAASEENLREYCRRQVAAKIVVLLPMDGEDAMKILDLVAGLVENFTSMHAVLAGKPYYAAEEEVAA
jgi:hypothetical protein